MVAVTVVSSEIARAELRCSLNTWTHIYAFPFLCFYPLLAYAYYVKYDDWLKSEEWTFLACVTLGAGHALSFLVTRWNAGAKAWITTTSARTLEEADCIRIIPHAHRGEGEIVPLQKISPTDPSTYKFTYQQDTYTVASLSPLTFSLLPYLTSSRPPLSSFLSPSSPLTRGLSTSALPAVLAKYGKNEFNIPIPSFTKLFGEHATAPFFVFQIFCVALWCLDEYWYYSLFTLFMLVMFECTVVWQRLRTLTEFRTMSVVPYGIMVCRDGKWGQIQSDELLPGDLVSVVRANQTETNIPADILLLHGSCIVNEAMLSGESTPLLKESIQLLSPSDLLDADGEHKNEVLFSGTKLLQATSSSTSASSPPPVTVTGSKGKGGVGGGGSGVTPDGGCLGLVLRTGFGTSQGQLVRTMIFSTSPVSASSLESILFILFLLIFAIAASSYVWVKGVERGLKKSKLLLDCVLIVTSVVPPELPMELSLAVNASLVALSKFAIFCTEPFRIPFAGRVDVCCFDKTGTITAENLVLEGVAGVDPSSPHSLLPVTSASRLTTLTLAAAHALVRLEDGTIVGDPMEKTTLEALGWRVDVGDVVVPAPESTEGEGEGKGKGEGAVVGAVSKKHGHGKGQGQGQGLTIQRRFQFSSALKRMSTVSSLPPSLSPSGFNSSAANSGPSTANSGPSAATSGRHSTLIAVKGAPETIRGMLSVIPEGYDEVYKGYTRRGSRVLALGMREVEGLGRGEINKLTRDEVESNLVFAGFLVFHCPLKPDAVESLKMLADSSHRCIMITGDNPLTAVHVAKDVEIIDREALILDVRENASSPSDLTWRTVDESKIIPVDPSAPLDTSLLATYDICITGPALKQFESRPEAWNVLVQHTWVYARVSPAQKEFILTSLKALGYTTLMAGDGTNDVGALKQAHIGVALLDGTVEDLKKIAERERLERLKKVYVSQLNISARFGQPPPPVPPAIAHFFPDAVEAQRKAAEEQKEGRKANPMEKFNLAAITDKMAEMEGEDDVPKIKLGDASCAAPFTSKLSNVSAITHIIRQGRCTLVATIQMYKILALNCLITAYSLSVQYLDGIKYGDYQVTITGMLMSVCFLCISRAKPVEKLSRERPLSNIFNFYVLLSVLMQFALHIGTMVYITELAHVLEERGPIDLEAKFEANLLNTAVFLLGLSQQVSTFAINYQGRPFREGIRENPALYWGLVGASCVAFSGSTDFMPEMNRWLQVVEMEGSFKFKLTASMILDFIGCWAIEWVCKSLFADLEPRELVTRGRERREKRRALQEEQKKIEDAKKAEAEVEKKAQ